MPLTCSKYFGSTDGIYIKKEYYEKYQAEKEQNKSTYRVKMLCNWCSSEQLCKEWSVMCEEGLRWKDIELTDSEVVDLVNLKFMYSLHDYSVYEIMAMRDFGKSFLRINQQVELAKQEMNDEGNKVLEAR